MKRILARSVRDAFSPAQLATHSRPLSQRRILASASSLKQLCRGNNRGNNENESSLSRDQLLVADERMLMYLWT